MDPHESLPSPCQNYGLAWSCAGITRVTVAPVSPCVLKPFPANAPQPVVGRPKHPPPFFKKGLLHSNSAVMSSWTQQPCHVQRTPFCSILLQPLPFIFFRHLFLWWILSHVGKCVIQMSHLWLSTYSLPFIHLWVFDLITDVEKKKLHLARTANCTRLLLIEVTATLTRPQERARRAGSMLGFCSNKGGDYAFSPVTGFQLHSFSLLARSIFFFQWSKENEGKKEGIIAPGHQVLGVLESFI